MTQHLSYLLKIYYLKVTQICIQVKKFNLLFLFLLPGHLLIALGLQTQTQLVIILQILNLSIYTYIPLD